MTAYTGLVRLTDQIIETAVDDHQHGLNGIALDNNLLTRLIKQITSMERFVAVLGTCDDRMYHWIRDSTVQNGYLSRARAARALWERLQRSGRGWRMDRPGGTIEPA
jgi:hypothetical protein